MTIKNTGISYGTLAKFLHWGTALLFVGVYVAIYYRHWFIDPCPRGQGPRDCPPEGFMMVNLHKSFGITILVFVLLRIIWRFYNRPPRPEPASRLEHFGAKISHSALYFFMIAMPVTGYVANGGGTDWFWLIDIPSFRTTEIYDVLVTQGLGIDFRTFERPLDYFHKQISGRWLVWMLIAVHAGAALYHHYGKKDQTLVRMLPRSLAQRLDKTGK